MKKPKANIGQFVKVVAPIGLLHQDFAEMKAEIVKIWAEWAGTSWGPPRYEVYFPHPTNCTRTFEDAELEWAELGYTTPQGTK